MYGVLDMEQYQKELNDRVFLVSMMMVNNETGALYDTAAVAKLLKAKCPDAFLHIDATQSYLKIPFTKAKCGADMITVAHRYLNERSFVKKEVKEKPFTASEADKFILADKTEDFRVLNLTVDIFNSSAPS